MKKSIVLFVVHIFCVVLYSQEEASLPRIIPPSPEAASLGKFTEIPVSHFTGLPNISIPLASFKVGEKTFPLGLSYHARGIMVEEIAPRVGIGWALNAGGTISRQARGTPDDKTPYGYLRSGNKLIPKLASGQWFNSLSSRLDYLRFDVDTREATDKLPDVYMLQVGGMLSAKFFLDYTNGQPVLQKFDDVKISYSQDSNGIIDGFVVRDSEGYTYYFGKSKDGQREARNWDKNMGNYAFPQSGSYDVTPSDFYKTYNSWQLMDIESPYGEMASLFYEEEISVFYRRSHDKKEGSNSQYPDKLVNYSSKIESHQYQLRTIVYQEGEIQLAESPTVREDLAGSHTLDKIDIFDKNDDFVKGFDFEYFYSTGPNDNNQMSSLKSLEPQSNKRLFLSSVVERGKGSVLSNPYIFDYNPKPLPNRFSNSQDAWGYYNGKNNGQFLTFLGSTGPTPNNRRVDTLLAEAGMLKKITYPTGGHTAFEYEHNKVVASGPLQELYYQAMNPTTTFFERLSPFEWQDTWDGNRFEKQLTIGGITGKLHYSIGITNPKRCQEEPSTCECSESAWVQGCPFQIYLQKEGGGVIQLFKGNHAISIAPGNYTIIADPQYPEYDPDPSTYGDDIFPHGFFNISMNWSEDIEDDGEGVGMIYAAGKRIKKIKYSSDGQNADYTREYDYSWSDGSTSGMLFGLPGFYSINTYLSSEGFYVLEPYGAVPGSPLSTYQGNSVGYRQVTEYYGGKDDNAGKTVRRYTVQEDTDDYYRFPYHPPTDNEWLRGLPWKVEHYKKVGADTYSIVKRTETKYLYGNYDTGEQPGTIPLIFTPLSGRYHKDDNVTYENNPPDIIERGLPHSKTSSLFRLPLVTTYFKEGDLYYKVFHATGGTVDKAWTIETDYFKDGASRTKKTTYNYNYDHHYQIKSATTTTSTGVGEKTTFDYSTDPSMSNEPNAGGLAAKNMISTPLKTEVFRDLNGDEMISSNEVISTQKTIYNTKLLPEYIQTSKGGQVLENRIQYHKYDSYGNPLEVSKAGGTHITYLWGYNGQYPVAKIENATYAEVIATGIELSVLQDVNSSEAVKTTALKELRNHADMAGARITTYTYNPLIGVSTITTPSGKETTYAYDDFNRLEFIRDEANMLLEEYRYHYKN